MPKTSAALPPDITVTRADVLALPSAEGDESLCPDEGKVWKLWRMNSGQQTGRLVWMEVPKGTPADEVYERGFYVSRSVADVAERAFLWQTALASDAALGDIGNEPPPAAPSVLLTAWECREPGSAPPAEDPAVADAFNRGVVAGRSEMRDLIEVQVHHVVKGVMVDGIRDAMRRVAVGGLKD